MLQSHMHATTSPPRPQNSSPQNTCSTKIEKTAGCTPAEPHRPNPTTGKGEKGEASSLAATIEKHNASKETKTRNKHPNPRQMHIKRHNPQLSRQQKKLN